MGEDGQWREKGWGAAAARLLPQHILQRDYLVWEDTYPPRRHAATAGGLHPDAQMGRGVAPPHDASRPGQREAAARPSRDGSQQGRSFGPLLVGDGEGGRKEGRGGGGGASRAGGERRRHPPPTHTREGVGGNGAIPAPRTILLAAATEWGGQGGSVPVAPCPTQRRPRLWLRRLWRGCGEGGPCVALVSNAAPVGVRLPLAGGGGGACAAR